MAENRLYEIYSNIKIPGQPFVGLGFSAETQFGLSRKYPSRFSDRRQLQIIYRVMENDKLKKPDKNGRQ